MIPTRHSMLVWSMERAIAKRSSYYLIHYCILPHLLVRNVLHLWNASEIHDSS